MALSKLFIPALLVLSFASVAKAYPTGINSVGVDSHSLVNIDGSLFSLSLTNEENRVCKTLLEMSDSSKEMRHRKCAVRLPDFTDIKCGSRVATQIEYTMSHLNGRDHLEFTYSDSKGEILSGSVLRTGDVTFTDSICYF